MDDDEHFGGAISSRCHNFVFSHDGVTFDLSDIWCGWIDVGFDGVVSIVGTAESCELLEDGGYIESDSITVPVAFRCDMLEMVAELVSDPTKTIEFFADGEEYGAYVVTVSDSKMCLYDIDRRDGGIGTLIASVCSARGHGYADGVKRCLSDVNSAVAPDDKEYEEYMGLLDSFRYDE